MGRSDLCHAVADTQQGPLLSLARTPAEQNCAASATPGQYLMPHMGFLLHLVCSWLCLNVGASSADSPEIPRTPKTQSRLVIPSCMCGHASSDRGTFQSGAVFAGMWAGDPSVREHPGETCTRNKAMNISCVELRLFAPNRHGAWA